MKPPMEPRAEPSSFQPYGVVRVPTERQMVLGAPVIVRLALDGGPVGVAGSPFEPGNALRCSPNATRARVRRGVLGSTYPDLALRKRRYGGLSTATGSKFVNDPLVLAGRGNGRQVTEKQWGPRCASRVAGHKLLGIGPGNSVRLVDIENVAGFGIDIVRVQSTSAVTRRATAQRAPTPWQTTPSDRQTDQFPCSLCSLLRARKASDHCGVFLFLSASRKTTGRLELQAAPQSRTGSKHLECVKRITNQLRLVSVSRPADYVNRKIRVPHPAGER